MNMTQVFQLLRTSSNGVTQPKETKRAKSDTINSVEEKYRIIFYEIIDILLNLVARFSSTVKKGIFQLTKF
jgi:hypothetical protein